MLESVEKNTNAKRRFSRAHLCEGDRHNAHSSSSAWPFIERHKIIWDVSAFYFVPVDRWIRSTRIGMRWRRSAYGARAHGVIEGIIDDHKCRRLRDSDLDFH
jgi:hypothetical protein